jgi:hypothetical protein
MADALRSNSSSALSFAAAVWLFFLMGLVMIGAALIGPPATKTSEVGQRIYLAATGLVLSGVAAALLRWLHRRPFYNE